MNISKFLLVAIIALTVISCNRVEKTQSSETYVYQPFPDGYDYGTVKKEIIKAQAENDRKFVREHAWKLWAGIMQPSDKGDWPIWYTWPNSKGAFETNTGDAKINHSVKSRNRANHPSPELAREQAGKGPKVNTPSPVYPVPDEIQKKYPEAMCKNSKNETTICDGPTFVNNGDILIPTESMSLELFDDIRGKELYLKKTLQDARDADVKMIPVSDKSIVTKHMYWPVKQDGITVVPVWRDNYHDEFEGYAGYEFWDTLIALAPDGSQTVGDTVQGSFLYKVRNHEDTKDLPTVTGDAVVHNISEFYFHQVTKEDWKRFSPTDKAIISAASIWANGRPFKVNDYLITIAMHVNTREVAPWTLQSVWWSETPNDGQYSQDRPTMPASTVGPWDHYLLTDAYAMNSPGDTEEKSFNPYIEGVIHPVGTSCRNCHVRAGWEGTRYQTKDCWDLLTKLEPDDACFAKTTLTDYLWIIPDRAQ